MNIKKSTKEYEKWLAGHIPVVQQDLDFKHQQMALAPFPFLRATYYRWAQNYADLTAKDKAVQALSVGDLHIENFGTWRDQEGRLIWGINDFDEATWLPYTNDLCRLACSVALALDECAFALDMGAACDAIMAGYAEALEEGGKPFVLAEKHDGLRRMASGALRDPVHFWQKMDSLPKGDEALEQSARAALESVLPSKNLAYEVRPRRAGLGSLGRPRFVATASWEGGQIAREAKAMLPSAAVWALEEKGPHPLLYQAILDSSCRCNDPFVRINGGWLLRRLAPDCSRIELSQIPAERDEAKLLEAMGFETGNIHVGSPDSVASIKADLALRPKKWLLKSSLAMKETMLEDYADWIKSMQGA